MHVCVHTRVLQILDYKCNTEENIKIILTIKYARFTNYIAVFKIHTVLEFIAHKDRKVGAQ